MEAMTNIYINLQEGLEADVEAHREDCPEAKKILRTMSGESAGMVPHGTPLEVWEEYNADFIEDEAWTWDVAIYPCTGLVERKQIVTGYSED